MKMKALRWYGIHDVRTEEIEKPAPAPGEALIRILYAGICGSDLHIYNKGMFIQNVPETMGHEFCGIVEDCSREEAADLSPGFSKGDLVIANPMVTCGECDSCRRGDFNTCEALGFIGEVRQGCFTKYICLPEGSLIRVPKPAGTDSVPEESFQVYMQKMALAEPLAVAVNVCNRAGLTAGGANAENPASSGQQAASDQAAASLAIIGAGPIGLLTAALAKQVCGIENVTVVNRSETRRHIAEQLGALALPALPDGARFDKVVEAAGSPATLRLALEHVRAGGQVLAVSVFEDGDCPIDANLIVGFQITLTGCNCYTTADLETAVALLASGRIDISSIITDIVSLDEGKAAFEKLCAKDRPAAKILFRME
ncbi:MAG: alcohol dehydrogenase catalytic domain-containing protein [Eubacteriales bacterium]|nr:alcohol dehydrogenase catalytic domain-containing protein [Eubacteriales bacterium]